MNYLSDQYVIFPSLGMYGRFGNQLFQIAATIAHAKKLKLKPLFRQEAYTRDFELVGCDYRWFAMPQHTTIKHAHMYAPGWNYEPIPASARVLHGYFQSPMWWNGECPLQVRQPTLAKYDRVVGHLRRGDYVDLERFHPPLPARYYEQAAKEIGRRGVLVTDDVSAAAQELPGWQATQGRQWQDFERMLQAETLIIANSSFSLWAAYLGAAKTVFYPVPWFGPALLEHDQNQLIPDDTPHKKWIPIRWEEL